MAQVIDIELVYAMKIKFQAGDTTYPGYLFRQRIRHGDETIDFCGIEVNKDHFIELKEDASRKGKLREG